MADMDCAWHAVDCGCVYCLRREIRALEAERDALRAALEDIEAMGTVESAAQTQRARDALGPEP